MTTERPAPAAGDGLSVAQMAQFVGVSGHMLRYYERARLIQPIQRTSGNQRRYRASDIEWVRFLLRLRQTGMNIAGMREYARLRALGVATLEARLDLLAEHSQSIDERISNLQDNQQALQQKIVTYQELIAHRDERTPAHDDQ